MPRKNPRYFPCRSFFRLPFGQQVRRIQPRGQIRGVILSAARLPVVIQKRVQLLVINQAALFQSADKRFDVLFGGHGTRLKKAGAKQPTRLTVAHAGFHQKFRAIQGLMFAISLECSAAIEHHLIAGEIHFSPLMPLMSFWTTGAGHVPFSLRLRCFPIGLQCSRTIAIIEPGIPAESTHQFDEMDCEIQNGLPSLEKSPEKGLLGNVVSPLFHKGLWICLYQTFTIH